MTKLKTENLVQLKMKWKAASLPERDLPAGFSEIFLQLRQSIAVKSMNQSQLP